MKKIAIRVIGILAVLMVLSIAKDVVIKASVENGVALVTGLRLSIESFKVGIISTLVDIKGLVLFNPKGFKDKVMMDMPEIYVDYVLPAILRGEIHLKKARLNLEEFTVVKNERGELNLNSLKVVQAQKEGVKKRETAKAPKIQIDELELKIGRVVYKDYTGQGAPSVKEFNINLNERYTNIQDAYTLVSLIVVKSLMNTSVSSLANFDLQGLKGAVSGTIANAKTIAVQTAAQAEEALKTTTKIAAETAKETREAVKKTTETLQDVFKTPFGSSEKK